MSEEKSWTIKEVEVFIWDHLCEAKESDKKGINFKPKFTDEDTETPKSEDFLKVIDSLKARELVTVSQPDFKHYLVKLTPEGERYCEERSKDGNDTPPSMVDRYV